jgi:hypothetical protein
MRNRVLFDSNTWRHVASPGEFLKDKKNSVYVALNELMHGGRIAGYLSETTIAIEQIKRVDRLNWIKTSTQYGRPVEVPGMLGFAGYAVGLLPSMTIESQAVDRVRLHLKDAAMIGMKILRVDRAAYPESSLLAELPSSDIEIESPANDYLMRQLFLAFETYGRGLANLKRLGMEHTSDEVGIHWSDGIASLDDSYTEQVASLFGEWADGDAVAAAIAHDIDVFCTNDKAKGASGANICSVLAPDFRTALTAKFGIEFMTPEEFLVIIRDQGN